MADHKVSRAETTEKQRIDTDPSKKREYMESAAPSIDYLVDPERFSTPTMGDFYLGAVDGVYLKKIDELAKKKLSGDGNDKDAAFYVEAPPVKEMGHENNVYYLKAHVSITDDDIDQGFFDGRTLNVNINDVSGNEAAVEELRTRLISTMKAYGSIDDASADNTYFSLRLVGLGCPATPKWAFEYDFKNSMLNRQDKLLSDIEGDTRYLFVNGLHDSSETLTFVKLAGKWREATFYDCNEGVSSFRWLMDPGDEAYGKARQAAKNLKALLDNSENEIYFIIGDENIAQDSTMSCASMGTAANDTAVMSLLSYSVHNAPVGCAYKTGYARTHQEAFRRFSGVAYIKQDGKFLNLAKLALTDETNEDIMAP